MNARGRRFVNEAVNYHDLNKVFRTIDPNTGTHAHIPAWMVVDSAYVSRYSIGGTPVGQVPSWAVSAATPSRSSAQRLRHRPRRAGRDASRSSTGTPPTATTRCSTAARARQDRYLGDATAAAPLPRAAGPQGPFHAIPIRPGTLGTCGGLVTDEDGRVLDRRGRPIGDLYAAGNVSATVFDDAYPGGGATLGSAITRAYAVGRALARAPDTRTPERGLDMTLHAVIYRYADDAAALDEHRPRHRDYLRSLFEAGRLVVSGPLTEGGGPGALLIFDADVRGAGRAAGSTATRSGPRADRRARDPGLEPGLRRRSARLTGSLDRRRRRAPRGRPARRGSGLGAGPTG